MRLILNVIWLVLCGIWMATAYALAGLLCFVLFFLVITIPFGGHLVTGVLLCLTIIGIPLGLANFKIIPISLLPLGVRIVPSDEPVR